MTIERFDVIGIGFGPANIALAIAFEESPSSLKTVFFESAPIPTWQENMLLTRADIQHHSLRDLVTLRNPRSRYSFTNYLHENERLMEHLNLPVSFPLRTEYADYITWVRKNIDADVRYGVRVTSIAFDTEHEEYLVTSDDGMVYAAAQLSLAPGRSARIPIEFAGVYDAKFVCHLTQYLDAVGDLHSYGKHRFAIVGGSQSAVELALDLRTRFPESSTTLLTRSWSLRAKDHSPFSEEIYFPEFTDYYHSATKFARKRLDEFTRPTNYSAADLDVLEELYVSMYEDRLLKKERTRVLGDTRIVNVERDASDTFLLDVTNLTTNSPSVIEADVVILATGFQDMGRGIHDEHHHPLLDDVVNALETDVDDDLVIRRDYSVRIQSSNAPIFLNGLCESSHGIGDAGSFSLLSLRAELIMRAMLVHAASLEKQTVTVGKA